MRLLQFFVRLANDVVDSKITIEIAEEAAIAFCKINGGGLGYKCEGTWACDDVCGGAVHEFAPVGTSETCFVSHLIPSKTTSLSCPLSTQSSALRR